MILPRQARDKHRESTQKKITVFHHVKEMITWWSNWNTEFFDSKYPQFTARPGFEGRVKQMRDAGIHVVPYTNGRLFDPSIAQWNATNASAHMCYSDPAAQVS